MTYQNYEWEIRTAPIESFPGASLAWVAYVVGLWHANGDGGFVHVHLHDQLNRVASTESAAHAQCVESVKNWIDLHPIS